MIWYLADVLVGVKAVALDKVEEQVVQDRAPDAALQRIWSQ